MKPLTKSQQKVFNYIKECSEEGRVPSVREICEHTGLKSTSTVHLHLKSLEEKGLIERDKGLNRSIRITGEEKVNQIPIMGRVTAGLPVLAVEDIEGYVPVTENLKRGRELFALRIDGESMINAGILDGDIVIALIEDEATCKRFYKENGHYRLQPENELFEPIIVDEVVLLGTVISLVRNYE